MLEETAQQRTALNWDVALQIERAAAEFEAAWRQGRPHEIAEVLQQNSAIPARELFCALAETELELRRLDGEMPDAVKWSERFPQWNREIEAIVRSIESESSTEARISPILQAGAEFGRYRILKEIGRGAMGIVFQAEVIVSDTAPRLASEVAEAPNKLSSERSQTFDLRSTSMNASRGATSPTKLRLGDVVAIKMIRLPQSLSETEQRAIVRRFYNEASATAALDHPHVIPIRDVGSVDGIPYFTMPFVAGGTLKDLKHEAPLDPIRAVRIVAAAARALHHAHRSGLFHRDIKPSNILIDSDDRVFVTDFGVSLHRHELGQGPGFAGTPLYMSPEQAAGQSDLIDGRSDVFSLGIVLYELLTGTHPHESPHANSADIQDRICHLPVPPLRQRCDVPRLLEVICLKALHRQPEDRYSTAQDFAEDLQNFIAATSSPRDVTWTRRVSFIIAAVLLVTVGSFALFSGYFSPTSQTELVSSKKSPDLSVTKAAMDSDRAAAEWVLTLKKVDAASVQIRLPKSGEEPVITEREKLPDEPFRVVGIQVWGTLALGDDEIEELIVPLSSLRSLDISFCPSVTERAVTLIKQKTKLTRLELSATGIGSAACLELFTALPHLASLTVWSNQFTQELADHIRATPKITHVGIHDCNDTQLRQLLAATHLERLNIYSTRPIKPETWRELPDRLTNLHSLRFDSANVTSADLKEIARCPKLHHLYALAKSISDLDLPIFESCQTLTELYLTNTSVTETGVRSLHQHLPRCRIVWDGGVIEPNP